MYILKYNFFCLFTDLRRKKTVEDRWGLSDTEVLKLGVFIYSLNYLYIYKVLYL